MARTEFPLIHRYFAKIGATREDVDLGIGDDAALLTPPAGHDLAVAVSTQVEGAHFPPGASPSLVAQRGFASAFNHLAAAAAEPAWLTLALSMPQVDEAWLEAFSDCLNTLTRSARVQLVGGDTTAGPLRVTLHAHGFVPPGQGPAPSSIQPEHLIYVTGTLGEAQLARVADQNSLRIPGQARRRLQDRVQRPKPRMAEGLALRGLASGAFSVTDGLARGLSRLLQATGTGARLKADSLPLSTTLAENLDRAGGWLLPLTATGDYELCFTVPPASRAELERRFTALPAGCACIGRVESSAGIRCVLPNGTDLSPIPE